MNKAREAILAGRVRADDAALAFDKGVASASLEEREDATALNDFDPAAHNRTIGRFAASSAAIRGELPRACPLTSCPSAASTRSSTAVTWAR